MKAVVGLTMVFLIMVSAGQAQTKTVHATKDTVVHGYVIDAMCAHAMMKKGNAAEKIPNHTRECCLMESCAASGYGVFSEGVWFKFDTRGNIKAKQLLEASKRTDHLKAEVSGALKGTTLTVASLKEE